MQHADIEPALIRLWIGKRKVFGCRALGKSLAVKCDLQRSSLKVPGFAVGNSLTFFGNVIVLVMTLSAS
jgi:hypothetical protein